MSFLPELAKTERLLRTFLCATEREVFDKFAGRPNAMVLTCQGCTGDAVYIPGTRDPEDRVLLVAHYDTVWSASTHRRLDIDGTLIWSADPNTGIGADNRLGCAALWMLRNTGHSILIVPDEEVGCQGSGALMQVPTYRGLLKQHSFMIQFDRRGSHDFVTYDCDSDEFNEWMLDRLPGYKSTYGSFSDICALMEPLDICGCNLSIGFYSEHSTHEHAEMLDFLRTVELTRRLLQGHTPWFQYKEEKHPWYRLNDDEPEWDSYAAYWNAKKGASNDPSPCDTPLLEGEYCDDCGVWIDEPYTTEEFVMCPRCGQIFDYLHVDLGEEQYEEDEEPPFKIDVSVRDREDEEDILGELEQGVVRVLKNGTPIFRD